MKDPKEALRKVHSLQEVETTLLSVQDALNNVRDQLFELRVYAVEDFAPPPEARRPATAERPEPQKKVTNRRTGSARPKPLQHHRSPYRAGQL